MLRPASAILVVRRPAYLVLAQGESQGSLPRGPNAALPLSTSLSIFLALPNSPRIETCNGAYNACIVLKETQVRLLLAWMDDSRLMICDSSLPKHLLHQ